MTTFQDVKHTLIRNDGARISYWQHQAPESRGVLLFIHGVASNHTRFSEFLQHTELTRSWDTLRLDLRGHAASVDRGVVGIDVWCADLCALLDVCGYARAVLVGHSLGANVAAHFAQRHAARVAGLILIDPVQPQALHWWLPQNAARAALKAAATILRWLGTAGLHRRELTALDLEQLDLQARALLAQGRDADMERLYSSCWEDLKYFPTATYLQDVVQVFQPLPLQVAKVPALMLLSVGNRSSSVELNRAYAASLPHCDIVEIKCNHWILTAAPGTARAAIEAWVMKLKQ
ncbi:MAG: alpha/beta hydrolase [Gammaproteobacteria bacterium]|nr:alpha/beta hydrolase [Gammaproteobacteria bacterium]